jgi:hypothetical protein
MAPPPYVGGYDGETAGAPPPHVGGYKVGRCEVGRYDVREDEVGGEDKGRKAAGYRLGEPVTVSRLNPSPTYGPGTGEAIVWLAFEQGAVLDELRVLIHDDRWRLLSAMPVPVTLAGVLLWPRRREVCLLERAQFKERLTRASPR